MAPFEVAATGGTFDVIHRGHMALLACAFESAKHVIIGLTGDEMARRRGKRPANGYEARHEALQQAVQKSFAGSFEISRLDDEFGPAVLSGRVGALVTSEETRDAGARLNELRAARGLAPVSVICVPMELAYDGRRISGTRIRGGQIDAEGRISQV